MSADLRRGRAVREFGERPLWLRLDSGKRLGALARSRRQLPLKEPAKFAQLLTSLGFGAGKAKYPLYAHLVLIS